MLCLCMRTGGVLVRSHVVGVQILHPISTRRPESSACCVCCVAGSDSDEEYDGGIGIWSIAWSPQGGQLIAGKQGATE